MLIDNVDLAARNFSRAINLGFRDPGNLLPYQVKSMTGIDADDIINQFVGNPTGDEFGFSIPKLVKREVVLFLGLNPDWKINQTFSDLRDEVYRLVGSCPSGMVWLRFNHGTSEDDSHVKAVLAARISKVEANHFVERPEIQVTITAEDQPMLQAPSVESDDELFAKWVENEELPGENAVKLEDLLSTAGHGFEADFTITGSTTTFKMEGRGTLEGLVFEIDGFNFEEDDRLLLSSRPENRYAYVQRGETVIHVVDKMTENSIWPIMLPGSNFYTYGDEEDWGTDSLVTWDEARWTPTYWGV